MRRNVSDDDIVETVRALYPADTVTGGVKASQVAGELDRSPRGMRTRLQRLVDEGVLEERAGVRGSTYAPPTE